MSERQYMPDDWFNGGIPSNVDVAETAWIDSSYSLAAVNSTHSPAVSLDDASGLYAHATPIVGPQGRLEIGAYTCVNSTNIVCHNRITIGSHCFIAWGVVISDSEPATCPVAIRATALSNSAANSKRFYPQPGDSKPIVIEDNVWIGFGAVIMPGVTLGRGCVIGCKTIVRSDIDPYNIVAGDPSRLIRILKPTDTQQVREQAIRELRHG